MSYFVVFALPNYKNFRFMEQINGLASLWYEFLLKDVFKKTSGSYWLSWLGRSYCYNHLRLTQTYWNIINITLSQIFMQKPSLFKPQISRVMRNFWGINIFKLTQVIVNSFFISQGEFVLNISLNHYISMTFHWISVKGHSLIAQGNT